MRILALDTATENCSAALMIDGRVLAREFEMERGHAERILPMVDELLAEAGITLRSLDAIAFGRGPGSFTGVRLAATVTQGLAFGAGLRVVPISDLRAVAQRVIAHDALISRVLVCNDARMSEVYWGCFERDAQGLAQIVGEEHVGKPAAVTLPPTWTVGAASATALAVAGRGFLAYGEALGAAMPDHSAVLSPSPYLSFLPRAAEILLLAVLEVTAGRLLGPEEAIPVYLRDNVAHVAQPKKPPP